MSKIFDAQITLPEPIIGACYCEECGGIALVMLQTTGRARATCLVDECAATYLVQGCPPCEWVKI